MREINTIFEDLKEKIRNKDKKDRMEYVSDVKDSFIKLRFQFEAFNYMDKEAYTCLSDYINKVEEEIILDNKNLKYLSSCKDYLFFSLYKYELNGYKKFSICYEA